MAQSSGTPIATRTDRKSTRLNSSHTVISYAVFCLKKKKKRSASRLRAPLTTGVSQTPSTTPASPVRLTSTVPRSASSVLFFFTMTRPPPRSTLFPYTTLFRSVHALDHVVDVLRRRRTTEGAAHRAHGPVERHPHRDEDRSEEHTSELQSHSDLVCRLLLEKKKKTLSQPSTRTPNDWRFSDTLHYSCLPRTSHLYCPSLG